MLQRISGELHSRQLKAEALLSSLRSSLESRAAGGVFHLIKADLPTLVWVDKRARTAFRASLSLSLRLNSARPQLSTRGKKADSRLPPSLDPRIPRGSGLPDYCIGATGGVDSRDAGWSMLQFLRDLWSNEEGQDIAEYAVMLAVILVLVIGTVRLIGGNANNAFSSVASNLQ